MNQEMLAERWNRKFQVGRRIVIERDGIDFPARTMTKAAVVNGVAMVWVDRNVGVIPLVSVHPITEEPPCE